MTTKICNLLERRLQTLQSIKLAKGKERNGHGYEGRGSKKGAMTKMWKTKECRMTTIENGEGKYIKNHILESQKFSQHTYVLQIE